MEKTLFQRVRQNLINSGLLKEESTHLEIEALVVSILDTTSNPSGLSEAVQLERMVNDRKMPHDKKFEHNNYTLDDMFNMVNYGHDYVLKCQTKGFVPKGNILQHIEYLESKKDD
ncbi:hypothetical protein BPT24_205 [Tenacibaculum phage pT24]|uniref:Uncharacterized protein n=1 Tax=Tenacibaculum phage pT24 TaxID=1880590 RepID=A0A1B4XX02_9CAUD|nr:hypothetical protein HYP10_gp205 [Tenacibaculum phage pT24]BAV39329.1 hypothetical protein BPT24_205 [Tenacibaculum phage pT24]